MRGKHRVIVQNERVKYIFDIKRNITILQGDSATGKTSLLNLLQLYAVRGESSGVLLQSDVDCVVYGIAENQWMSYFEMTNHAIVFIDEDYRFVHTKEFAEKIQNTDNYYVIISRRPLRNLPYSVKEIYGIRTSGKYSFPEQVYNEFYPIYKDIFFHEKPYLLITEDEKSGYQFFQKSFTKVECIAAKGNTKIVALADMMTKDRSVVVIADGAAFGAFIDDLVGLMEENQNLGIYLPECFEWLILKSDILHNADVDEILKHPEDYIDGREYFSWEQYFTDLLFHSTADKKYMRYNKSILPEYYLTDSVKNQIIKVLPDQLSELNQKK